MILKKKESAEQKLLKMMEASSGEGSGASKAKQKVDKKQDLLTAIKTFNKFLILAILGIAVLVGLEVKAGMDLLGKDINITATSGSNSGASQSGLLPMAQKLPYYLAGAGRRNIFEPYEPGAMLAESRQSDQMNITRKTQSLKLVGISWLDRVDTASAMIEDTDKQVTYFLQKGEEIGNIKVKTIYADSVELGYENEEMILRYEKPQL